MSGTLSPKLAQSLFECQTEVDAVVKDAKNPHFKSKYATINSVIDTLKPALIKSKLFVLQPLIQSDKDGYVAIRTIIGHASGESLEYVSEMKIEGTGPQKMVSGLTYLRRAALVSLFMLEQEDDDGNAAQKPVPKEAVKADPFETIMLAARKNGWNEELIAGYINLTFDKESFSNLTRDEQIQLYKAVSAYGPTHP